MRERRLGTARHSQRAASALLLTCLLTGPLPLSGCGSDTPQPPLAPRRTTPPVNLDMDAGSGGGSPGELPDAGGVDANVPSGPSETGDCDTQTPIQGIMVREALMSDPIGTTTESPTDFEVRRIAHRFADCDPGVLELTFGGGTCSNPSGPSLRFLFDTDAIAEGQVRQGQVPVRSDLSPGNAGISVRFSRPSGTNAGEWGSCGTPNGSIDLIETPTLERDGHYVGSYDLNLPACGDSEAEPVVVRGTFNVSLASSFAEACDESP